MRKIEYASPAMPDAFIASWDEETRALRRRLEDARAAVSATELPDDVLRVVADLNARLEVDGHRGELTVARAARAHAAWQSREAATVDDVRAVASMALAHRLRRDPLDGRDSDHRLDETLASVVSSG